MERKYTAKFFRDSLPEWKRKKDSLLVRHFFRPISFYTASVAANIGIGANDVSYFSMLVAIIGSLCYVIGQRWANIVGALLVIFWMVLDCTDGNLARSIKKQPFGEFADGASSYILINFLFSALGITTYKSGGLIFDVGAWILLFLGVFGGGTDSLARLLYQKFENDRKMQETLSGQADTKETRTAQNKLIKLHDRIDKELGLNGIFLPAILVCSIFNWLDVFVLFYSSFYIVSLMATIVLLIKKAKKAEITD